MAINSEVHPIITIGIPCFNSERWVKSCIESALNQTWPNKDIIVVDDGSTDSSAVILKEFGDSIRTLFTNHQGANHARNQILRHARGEWIQYLDADDCLLPDKLSRQWEEISAPRECDMIYSPVLIEEAGKRVESPIDTRLDVYAQWISWQLPQTGGGLWRKSSLEKINGWNETMPCCQEHELYMRAIKEGMTFRFAPSANAVYRVWSDETLCRRDPRLVIETKTSLIDDLREWMAVRGVWTEQHQAIAGQACLEMARTMAKWDIDAATRYYADRKQRNLINPEGPAAPFTYKFACRLLGFAGAEKLARILR